LEPRNLSRSGKALFVAVPLALLLLLAFIPAAHATPPPNELDLTITGSIDSVSQQTYTQSGGVVVSAYILGEPVDTSTAVFTESLSASVAADGLTTTGTATFSLSGNFLDTGTSFTIGDTITIDGAIPAESFPLGCTTCTSQVPGFFVGTGALGGWDLESAFLNPFGGPVVWASTDGSVVIVFSYTAATIDWQNVQSTGSLSGTLGATLVSGSFTETTNAHEDLRAGTETESGTLTFLGMTPSCVPLDATCVSLDASGPYSGTSTIPSSSTVDCSAPTGLPEGTCTETGFNSIGEFTLDPGTLITGTYGPLAWAVPALSFSGPATATVSQGVSGVPQFGTGAIAPVAMGLALLLLLRKGGLGARARD